METTVKTMTGLPNNKQRKSITHGLIFYFIVCLWTSCSVRSLPGTNLPCSSSDDCARDLVCKITHPGSPGRCLHPNNDETPSDQHPERKHQEYPPETEGNTDNTPCLHKTTRPCTTRLPVTSCKPIQQCNQGTWGTCKIPTPTKEECNGLDDDCNGKIDDNLPQTPCYTGPEGTQGVGLCKVGTKLCKNRLWQCVGEITPQPNGDLCNSDEDGDCDGKIIDSKQCMWTALTGPQGQGFGEITKMIADGEGGVYVLGTFSEKTLTFNGLSELPGSTGKTPGVFLIRINKVGKIHFLPSGNSWLNALFVNNNSTGQTPISYGAWPTSMVLDATKKQLIVVGRFAGSLSLNQKNIYNPDDNGKTTRNMFIWKISTTENKTLSFKNIPSFNPDSSFSNVVINQKGQLFAGGSFSKDLSIPLKNGKTTTLQKKGILDIFLLEFDETLQIIRASSWGGQGRNQLVSSNGLIIDKNQQLILLINSKQPKAGPKHSISFDNKTISLYKDQALIVSLDQNWKIQWGKASTGEGLVEGTSLALSQNQVLFVAGRWKGESHLFSPTTTTKTPGISGWLASFKPTGELLWDKPLSPNTLVNPNVVTTHSIGNADLVYIVGFFENTLKLSASWSATTRGQRDGLIARYSASGALVWAETFGGIGSDKANDLVIDPKGQLFAGGSFAGAAQLGGQEFGQATTTNSRSFIWKMVNPAHKP